MGNDWLLVCFTALVLTGAGITVAVAVGESRNAALKLQTVASLVALLVLAVGGGFAVMHLGRPAMIFGALGNPTTGIFREFVTFGLTTLAIVTYLIALLRGAEASTTLWLSRFAAIAAVLLSLAVGSAFVMPWRPAWDTWTLVLPYMGWALWCSFCGDDVVRARRRKGSRRPPYIYCCECDSRREFGGLSDWYRDFGWNVCGAATRAHWRFSTRLLGGYRDWPFDAACVSAFYQRRFSRALHFYAFNYAWDGTFSVGRTAFRHARLAFLCTLTRTIDHGKFSKTDTHGTA